jgi:hypothetical protein
MDIGFSQDSSEGEEVRHKRHNTRRRNTAMEQIQIQDTVQVGVGRLDKG